MLFDIDAQRSLPVSDPLQRRPRRALLVIAYQPPFPVCDGASVDQWNRYQLMRDLGWDLTLASWVADATAPAAAAAQQALRQIFSEVFLFPNWTFSASLRRLAWLPWTSPRVSSRLVGERAKAPLLAALRRKGVSAIVLEGFCGSLLARSVAAALDAPLFLRCHNVEFDYLAKQSRAASTLAEKLRIRLGSAHLERVETELHHEACWSFDCSDADLAFWRKRGFSRQSWAPPMFDPSKLARPRKLWAKRAYDIVYLGNLSAPNNVEGVLWFLNQVTPVLFAERPTLKLLIAGSNPVASILHARASTSGIDFAFNIADPAAVRGDARVLINPIFAGSGVNVKSIEMLFTDSPLVVSPAGVQGLPPAVREAFVIRQSADGFAAAVLNALEAGPAPDSLRDPLRRCFGPAAARRFSDKLYAEILRASLPELTDPEA